MIDRQVEAIYNNIRNENAFGLVSKQRHNQINNRRERKRETKFSGTINDDLSGKERSALL